MPSSLTGSSHSSKKPRGESSSERGASTPASALGGQSSCAPSAAERVLALDTKRSKAKSRAKPAVTIDLTDDGPVQGVQGAVGSGRGPSASTARAPAAPRCELAQPISAKQLEEIARATLAAHGRSATVAAPPAPAAEAASPAAGICATIEAA